MKSNLNRNEKILAYTTLAVIAGFGFLFTKLNLKPTTSASQIGTGLQVDYKMARPEESYSEYSLNGREIDHTYEAIKRKEAAQAAEKAKAVAALPQTEAQKKQGIEKKKVEAAQKAAAASKTQAQAAKATNLARQKAMAEQAKTSSSETQESAAESDRSAYEHQRAAVNEQPPSDGSTEDPNALKKKDKKTFAQWREQIYAQPTRENMNLFLEAYRKGEVTPTEVQAMAQDLLDQNNDALKGLGLYALRATPSLASLSQLVHAEASVNATYKTYIEQAYLAYLQPQNVNVLNQALQTKDNVLIAKTLTILNVNLPNIAKGDNSTFDSRSRPDKKGTDSNITISSFSSLLPALTALAGSQEYAAIAQQVMAYIQSSNTVAQF